ncbi:hypothetical protein B0H13DRAFT_1901807 [Mycena leptocephala]|nr:hypothetical protein B0H13DRAFT_1901807 [Mycena leptocephala]
MSSAIVPQWLTSLATMKSLLQFLSEPGISALTKDIYSVDLHPGVHGRYVYPESACTKDNGNIYYTYIFGHVCLPESFSDAKGNFCIEGGGHTASPSFEAFARQTSRLAHILKEGDDKDANIGQDSRVSPFTDSNRVDMAGGTYIEIELGFSPIYLQQGPQIPKSQDSAAPCWMMHTIQACTPYPFCSINLVQFGTEFPLIPFGRPNLDKVPIDSHSRSGAFSTAAHQLSGFTLGSDTNE